MTTIEELEARVAKLEQELTALRGQAPAPRPVEGTLSGAQRAVYGMPERPAPAAVPSKPESRPVVPEGHPTASGSQGTTPGSQGIAPGSQRTAPEPQPYPISSVRRLGNALTAELLETRLGGTWANRAGIVAILFGLGFFLRYSFVQGWIGPAMRVGIGLVAGLLLLAAGEASQRRGYRIFAVGLIGGGVGALYFSIFAAFAFYHLIGLGLAFTLMSVTTAAAVAFAVRHDVFAVAMLGFVGGFLTPFILRADAPHALPVLIYAAFLDMGILAVTWSRDWNWRPVAILSVAATTLLLPFHADLGLIALHSFHAFFFTLFSILPLVYAVLRPARAAKKGVLFIGACATLWTLVSLVVFSFTGRDNWKDMLLVAVLVYSSLGWVALSWDRSGTALRRTYWWVAAIFLTLAVPAHFEERWVPFVWGAQALAFVWASLRVRSRRWRQGGLVVFCLAAIALVRRAEPFLAAAWYQVVRTPADRFWPLFNPHSVPFLGVIAAVVAAGFLLDRSRNVTGEEEQPVAGWLFAAGSIVAAVYLCLESVQLVFAWDREFGVVSSWPTVHLVQAVLVSGEGLFLTWLGKRRLAPDLQLVGVMGLFVAVSLLFLGALPVYETTHARELPLLHLRTVPFMAVTCAVLLAARLLTPSEDHSLTSRRASTVAVLVGNGLLWAYLALEGHQTVAGWAGELGVTLPTATFMLLLSALTMIDGYLLAWLGKRLSSPWLQLAAALALCGGLLFLFIGAVPLYWAGQADYLPLVHVRSIPFALGVAALLASAPLLGLLRDFGLSPIHLSAGAAVTANLLAMAYLGLEIQGFYDAWGFRFVAPEDITSAMQATLSVVWALYGVALAAVGFARRRKTLRYLAIAALGVVAVKVFLFDLASLGALSRIISFIVVGALLVLVSFFYRNQNQRASVDDRGPRG